MFTSPKLRCPFQIIQSSSQEVNGKRRATRACARDVTDLAMTSALRRVRDDLVTRVWMTA